MNKNQEELQAGQLNQNTTLEDRLFDILGAYTIIRNGTQVYPYPNLPKNEYQPREISARNARKLVDRILKIINAGYVKLSDVELDEEKIEKILLDTEMAMETKIIMNKYKDLAHAIAQAKSEIIKVKE